MALFTQPPRLWFSLGSGAFCLACGKRPPAKWMYLWQCHLLEEGTFHLLTRGSPPPRPACNSGAKAHGPSQCCSGARPWDGSETCFWAAPLTQD